MNNAFALPVAKPRNSNDRMLETPTKNGRTGISQSRLIGDTISSSMKKRAFRSVQFKEENTNVPVSQGNFRSNSTLSGTGKGIGQGLAGKGVQVSSI